MGKVYLLRHGRTAWNKDKIFRGRADVPLDEHGLAQAKCVAQALKGIEIGRIYSSPLSRAVQTAEPVAACKQLPLNEVPEFLDIDYGQWTSKADEQVRQLFPELYQQWLIQPEQVHFPDGEDLAGVRYRAFAKLEKLAAEADEQSILMVTHRVVLKVLLCSAMEMGLSKFWQVQVDTASLSVLGFEQGGLKLLLLNDTCHLRSLDMPSDSVDF